MELEFKDPFLLHGIFSMVGAHIMELNLVFDKDSISARTFDMIGVSCLDLKLDVNEVCNTYKYKHDAGCLNLGICVKHFMTVMKLVDRKSTLGLICNNPDKLTFSIKDDKNVCQFDLKLMEIETEPFDVDFPFETSSISFDAKYVSGFLSKINDTCDIIKLGICKDDKGSLFYNAEMDEGEIFGKLINGEAGGSPNVTCTVRVSRNLLNSYSSVKHDISKRIKFVFIDEANPLRISYDIGENNVFDLYIAPKVDLMDTS